MEVHYRRIIRIRCILSRIVISILQFTKMPMKLFFKKLAFLSCLVMDKLKVERDFSSPEIFAAAKMMS